MKFLSRLLATQVIQFKSGKAISQKGKHTNRLLSELSTMCQTHEIHTGEIWISGDLRINFSKEIPEKLHQRFKNIINNSEY